MKTYTENKSNIMTAKHPGLLVTGRVGAQRSQEATGTSSGVHRPICTELGKTSVATHRIDTGDSGPVRQPPRRVPFSLRSKVEKLVHEMLDQGTFFESVGKPYHSGGLKGWYHTFLRGL